MIITLCISLLIPLLIGFIIVRTFLPLKKTASGYSLLIISLAIGLGLGMTSCTYLLFLVSIGPQPTGIIIYDAVLLIFSIIIFVRYAKIFISSDNDVPDENTFHAFKLKRSLSIGFYSVIVLALINIVYMAMLMPYGKWDAWAIWNQRARFIFRGGEHWTDAFSSLLALKFHPDYPLLLPLSTARCWTYIGEETHIAAMLISLLFTFAIVGVLYSALKALRSNGQAMIASLVLLCTPFFLLHGAGQLADIPVGFFYLASLVLLFLQDRFQGNYGFSAFSGVMAGFAGWTKNEGLLFLAALFLALLLVIFLSHNGKTQRKQLIYFALGSMPILAVILYFKIYLAPSNDIMSEQTFGAILAKLIEFDRHMQIVKGFLIVVASKFLHVVLLIFYFLYSGIKIDNNGKIALFTSVIVLFLMILGYYLVYLITPHDLGWHLKWSLDRVLLQLWPSILLTYFMIVRTPEGAMIRGQIKF